MKTNGSREKDVWDDIFQGIRRLFLDTAPLIYYVEKHPHYAKDLRPVFDRIDKGLLTAFTSPITLAECLVHPYRQNLADLQKDFSELIVNGKNTVFVPIDQNISQKAAQLRASYSLSLTDALQIATALAADCDALLTNDMEMKRITEIKIVALADVIKK
ncbi:MAG: PIN domain-containing protein [Syntrophales bacterium]|nr:PIN domain-containing protein [Syntrophales bacterium]